MSYVQFNYMNIGTNGTIVFGRLSWKKSLNKKTLEMEMEMMRNMKENLKENPFSSKTEKYTMKSCIVVQCFNAKYDNQLFGL